MDNLPKMPDKMPFTMKDVMLLNGYKFKEEEDLDALVNIWVEIKDKVKQEIEAEFE